MAKTDPIEPTIELAAPFSETRELVELLTGDVLTRRALEMAETDIPAVTLPPGWTLQHLHDETLLARPTRKRGVVRFENPADLIGYLEGHADEGTTLWMTPTQLRVEVLLNDHDGVAGGWGDHRAILTLRASNAWQRILDAARGGRMHQQQFAELLDDLQDVVVDPVGSDLLDLVDSMEGTATQRVIANNVTGHNVSVTLEAGQQVKARSGLEIPTKITVELQPYRHLEYAARFQLRIRITVADGRLTFDLSIVKHEDLIEAAQAHLGGVLSEAGHTVWDGTPRGGA